MKIKKTATEIKQETFMRSYKQSRDAKKRHKERKKRGFPKRVKTKPPYESEKRLRQMSYHEFLLSKYWQFVRKNVLSRDGYKCVICKSETDLQIHHDTYKHHFKELEHLGDLMTLCAKCHTEHHYAQM